MTTRARDRVLDTLSVEQEDPDTLTAAVDGWRFPGGAPRWTPETSLAFINGLGIQKAIAARVAAPVAAGGERQFGSAPMTVGVLHDRHPPATPDPLGKDFSPRRAPATQPVGRFCLSGSARLLLAGTNRCQLVGNIDGCQWGRHRFAGRRFWSSRTGPAMRSLTMRIELNYAHSFWLRKAP
jgi:hypothetical protein